MMARHGKRRKGIAQPRRHLRARRSVIHLSRMRRVALPLLPVGAVFADVVQQPRPMAVLLRAKYRRKFSRQRRDVLLVLPQRLIRSVRLQVRDIIHFIFPPLCADSVHRPSCPYSATPSADS